MGIVSYDPEDQLDIDARQITLGRMNGMNPAYVICDSEECGTASFLGFFFSTPKVGEIIYLENSKICKIDAVVYKITDLCLDEVKIKILIPNVYAFLVNESGESI